MRYFQRIAVFVFSVILLAQITTALAQDDLRTPGIQELYRLDRLPMLKDSVEVASISSYDRTGGNNDGFEGRYSFVRKEEGGLVLADLKGPGVIYRLWTPTPTDDVMEFYFDGESEPRIQVQFNELFMGGHPAFPRPLVGYGAGGFYSYVPIPFEKSCKVFIRAQRMRFYQINYAIYPEGKGIVSYPQNPSAEQKDEIENAKTLFGMAGEDISEYVVPKGGETETLKTKIALQPGNVATVADIEQPGRIVGLRLGPLDALAGKKRDIILRVVLGWEVETGDPLSGGRFFWIRLGRTGCAVSDGRLERRTNELLLFPHAFR